MTRALARLAALGPVAADPYPWPYDGTVTTDRVALICRPEDAPCTRFCC